MRAISEDKMRELWDVYKAQFKRSAKAQGGSKKAIPKTPDEELTAYNNFRIDVISMREDLASSGGGRTSNKRIAQDLARRDVYYGSYQQGKLYYEVLERSGYFENAYRFDERTGEMVEWRPNKVQFALAFQKGTLDEDEFDEAARASIAEEYNRFRDEYIKKHGTRRGVAQAWNVQFRAWYYGE